MIYRPLEIVFYNRYKIFKRTGFQCPLVLSFTCALFLCLIEYYIFKFFKSFHCDRVLWVVHQKGRSSCRQAGCGAGAGADCAAGYEFAVFLAVGADTADPVRSIFHAEILLKYRP